VVITKEQTEVCNMCWDKPRGQMIMHFPANVCFSCAKQIKRVLNYAADVGWVMSEEKRADAEIAVEAPKTPAGKG
jgi:hypothetical protein